MAKITTTQEVPDLLTIIEAAKMIGISQSSLYGYIRAGKVETVKIGRQMFLTRGEINRQFYIVAGCHLLSLNLQPRGESLIQTTAKFIGMDIDRVTIQLDLDDIMEQISAREDDMETILGIKIRMDGLKIYGIPCYFTSTIGKTEAEG